MPESDPTQPSTNPAQKAFENVNAGRDIKADIRQESNIRSAIVSGNGNVIVIQQTTEQRRESLTSDTTVSIGPNPYKGLAAFNENDAEHYFGREEQVKRLYERFQNLVEQSGRADAMPRFLPILGPSGCGKSSLARAGLIPELARNPLPGKESLRVAVMVPGSRPLEALAGLLLKAATDDPLPVEKTEEFERMLKKSTDAAEYEGLRRITDLMPGIREMPLVVLVDQFEEVYSLCKDLEQRQAFIGTLFQAASDPTGHVSVVITLRNDFWGETQRHQKLNQIIGSDWSLNVPAMKEDELRRAIAEPAKQAGHPLDDATIDQLVKDAEGREGALPLLQVALTRIWEELGKGKNPAQTYREIGHIGGAIANEAQKVYGQLDQTEQNIARRLFLGLIQVGENNVGIARKRITLKELITKGDTPENFYAIVEKFSSTHNNPGPRLITLSGKGEGTEKYLEITHEALFKYWGEFAEWIEKYGGLLYQKQFIVSEAKNWSDHGRSKDYLLQGGRLLDAKGFLDNHPQEIPLSEIAEDFTLNSIREKRKRRIQFSILIAGATGLSLFLAFFSLIESRQRRLLEVTKDVFIGNPRPELLDVLPEIKNEAEKLESHNPERAMALYRDILTFTGKLREISDDESNDFSLSEDRKATINKIETKAQNSLLLIIEKTRLPILESYLSKEEWGALVSNSKFYHLEDQFTEGALRETYKILMTDAGADINQSGLITTQEEANRMPCELIQEIESLWRQYTEETCGWYGSERKLLAPECKDLSQNESLAPPSLHNMLFYTLYEVAETRIDYCLQYVEK